MDDTGPYPYWIYTLEEILEDVTKMEGVRLRPGPGTDPNRYYIGLYSQINPKKLPSGSTVAELKERVNEFLASRDIGTFDQPPDEDYNFSIYISNGVENGNHKVLLYHTNEFDSDLSGKRARFNVGEEYFGPVFVFNNWDKQSTVF